MTQALLKPESGLRVESEDFAPDASLSKLAEQRKSQPDHIQEFQLLCHLCRPEWDETAEIRTEELLAPDVNWARLDQLARYHRVTPLLHRGLKRIAGAAPPDLAATLRDAYRTNAARSLQLAGQLDRLVRQFQHAGIEILPFKGPMLAQLAYGDVALRQAGDLDLLVPREQIVAAVDLLESLGHRPIFPTSTPREARFLNHLSGRRRERYLRSHSEHHLVHPETQLNVDLHWAVALREFAVRLDQQGMWRRAIDARPVGGANAARQGRTIRTLCPDDLLIVLCVNGTKDGWQRLDRICDIAHLVCRRRDELHFDENLSRANVVGVRRMVCVGLGLAAHWMGVSLPPHVSEAIERDPAAGRLIHEIGQGLLQNSHSPHRPRISRVRQAMVHLRTRERWLDRLHYCAAHLQPSVGDWALLPLPPSLSFVHYVFRPFRLMARYMLSPERADPS